jgi:hypothetical protein
MLLVDVVLHADLLPVAFFGKSERLWPRPRASGRLSGWQRRLFAFDVAAFFRV